MTSPHEDAARARKALRLLSAIDTSTPTVNDPQDLATVLSGDGKLADELWKTFAFIAKVNPPGERTKELVLNQLRDRARGQANADPFARL